MGRITELFEAIIEIDPTADLASWKGADGKSWWRVGLYQDQMGPNESVLAGTIELVLEEALRTLKEWPPKRYWENKHREYESLRNPDNHQISRI